MHEFEDPDKHAPPTARDRWIERALVLFSLAVFAGLAFVALR